MWTALCLRHLAPAPISRQKAPPPPPLCPRKRLKLAPILQTPKWRKSGKRRMQRNVRDAASRSPMRHQRSGRCVSRSAGNRMHASELDDLRAKWLMGRRRIPPKLSVLYNIIKSTLISVSTVSKSLKNKIKLLYHLPKRIMMKRRRNSRLNCHSFPSAAVLQCS